MSTDSQSLHHEFVPNGAVSSPRWLMLAFCAFTMAYGWGWRGSYGHEQGAMFAGAIMGMAVCLASGRESFYRRTAIAGVFGAAGWGWGGGLSNMEQTFYVRSDSFPDVAYAFACFYLFGVLWAGIGAACLSLALTLPRSQIRGFVVTTIAIAVALAGCFVTFFFFPDMRRAIAKFGEQHFHDSKYFSASLILVVSTIVWMVRPSDRPEAWLFLKGAVAWWAGYLLLTKFGGLVLAPPHRSESWSGFVGVLVILLHHLRAAHNRAALMFTIYGMITGGFAFMLALLIPHPMNVRWGPFATYFTQVSWKWSEELFGLFMGLGIGYAAWRLLRQPLQAPAEDVERKNSDFSAVFFLFVCLPWANFWKNVQDWTVRYQVLPKTLVNGLYPWQWFLLVGLALTLLGCYVMRLLWTGRLNAFLPRTSFGKAAILFLIVLWTGQFGLAMHRFMDQRNSDQVLVEVSYWLLAIAATFCLFLLAERAPSEGTMEPVGTSPSAVAWATGRRLWISLGAMPLVVCLFASIAIAVQDGPDDRSRWRFGSKAYWRNPARRSEVALEKRLQKQQTPEETSPAKIE